MSVTVDDAVEALTDPDLRGAGRGESGLVPMHGSKVLVRLQEAGATEEQARTLARKAVVQLDGEDRSHWLENKGLAAGRLTAKLQWIPEYWVPESKLRRAP